MKRIHSDPNDFDGFRLEKLRRTKQDTIERQSNIKRSPRLANIHSLGRGDTRARYHSARCSPNHVVCFQISLYLSSDLKNCRFTSGSPTRHRFSIAMQPLTSQTLLQFRRQLFALDEWPTFSSSPHPPTQPSHSRTKEHHFDVSRIKTCRHYFIFAFVCFERRVRGAGWKERVIISMTWVCMVRTSS